MITWPIRARDRQGPGHRCWRPAHPPKGRLTALHSRSQPRHIYGFLQTRPYGNPPTQTAASRPPGQFRAAPLPHRCWVPPVRAPVQDSHLRSQTSCPAHRCAGATATCRSEPASGSFLNSIAPVAVDDHPPQGPARAAACPRRLLPARDPQIGHSRVCQDAQGASQSGAPGRRRAASATGRSPATADDDVQSLPIPRLI